MREERTPAGRSAPVIHASNAPIEIRISIDYPGQSAATDAPAEKGGRLHFMPRPQLSPLREQIESYADYLSSLGRSKKHVHVTRSRCIALIEGCGFNDATDLAVVPIQKWVANHRESGATTATTNGYIASIRAFAGWLEAEGALERSPLYRLKPGNAEATRKRVRRALTEPEVEKLFEALPGAPDFRKLSWAVRRALYATGMLTGLRAGEIGKMRAKDIDLDAGVIRLGASVTKNRKAATVAIHKELAPMLAAVLQFREPEDLVFPGSWYNHAAKMLRLDLERAKVNPVDERGRVADFHAATRVTFGTRLAEREVPIQIAQKLLRHSTPALTSNIYTDVRPDVQADWVSRLTPVHHPASDDGAGAPEAETTEDRTDPQATRGKARRHPDSNRGWWICNESTRDSVETLGIEALSDSRLEFAVRSWPSLPEDARRAISAIVRSFSDDARGEPGTARGPPGRASPSPNDGR